MQNVPKQRAAIRFGEFELHQSGELRSQGRKIKLQEQPLQILRILTERRAEIVTRERRSGLPTPSLTLDQGLDNAIKRLDLAEAVLPSVHVQRGKSASRSRHAILKQAKAEYAKLQ
jgi:hypothetical protein